MLGKRGIVPRMSTARTIAMTGATILLASLISAAAFAQQKPLGEHLLGSWMLISHEAARPDGSKAFPYGPSPQGIAIFDASGRFIITVMRSGRSKYAAALPSQGSAEENRVTAEGTMTYFGTYSVSDADSTIAIHIEASSFPNWNGTDQKRDFAISGDQLTLTARALPTGGRADVVWKRVK